MNVLDMTAFYFCGLDENIFLMIILSVRYGPLVLGVDSLDSGDIATFQIDIGGE